MAVPIRGSQLQTSSHYLGNGLIIEDDQSSFLVSSSSLCCALQTEGRDSSHFILCTKERQSDFCTSQPGCARVPLSQPHCGCSQKEAAAISMPKPAPEPALLQGWWIHMGSRGMAQAKLLHAQICPGWISFGQKCCLPSLLVSVQTQPVLRSSDWRDDPTPPLSAPVCSQQEHLESWMLLQEVWRDKALFTMSGLHPERELCSQACWESQQLSHPHTNAEALLVLSFGMAGQRRRSLVHHDNSQFSLLLPKKGFTR